MFLKEYFKKQAERKAKNESKKAAKLALLEQRKKYWELSRTLYETIRFINRHMDNSFPIEYTPSEWPELGKCSLKIDDKLTIEIKRSFPEEAKLIAHEATFIIDNVPVDVDLTTDWMPEFGKLGTIVCDELEKRVKEYSEKKKSVVDDYIKWKEKKDLSNENKGD